MKSIVLTKYGSPGNSFEIREQKIPEPQAGQVLVKAEVSGLNYADIMARKGLYRDAPPLPCILGYDMAGIVQAVGKDVMDVKPGQRVAALTRFGGYAEYAVTDSRAVVALPDVMDGAVAAALTTQGCTAYFAACEMVNLHEGDHVLIHAAAGGVGTALVQLAKNKGCVVYGTYGSDSKLAFLKSIGVDYPINYSKTDFVEELKKLRHGGKVDVVFDSLGGKVFKKSQKALAYGGRIVGFGAAERSDKGKSIFADIGLLLDFGILHPAFLLMNSKGVIGVNMLRIADHQPEVLKRCLKNVVEFAQQKIIQPHIGGRFHANDIAKAHELLESRMSMGKIVVEW